MTKTARNELNDNTFPFFLKLQQNRVSTSNKISLLSPTESAIRSVKNRYYHSIDMDEYKIQFYS